MGLFDGFDKLITEHGSATISKERIELVKEQYSALEKQVADLQRQLGRSDARLETEILERDRLKRELEALKAEYAEETRIYKGLEFRRGKRTAGVWQPFCPTCHGPINFFTGMANCANQKCSTWHPLIHDKMVEQWLSEL